MSKAKKKPAKKKPAKKPATKKAAKKKAAPKPAKKKAAPKKPKVKKPAKKKAAPKPAKKKATPKPAKKASTKKVTKRKSTAAKPTASAKAVAKKKASPKPAAKKRTADDAPFVLAKAEDARLGVAINRETDRTEDIGAFGVALQSRTRKELLEIRHKATSRPVLINCANAFSTMLKRSYGDRISVRAFLLDSGLVAVEILFRYTEKEGASFADSNVSESFEASGLQRTMESLGAATNPVKSTRTLHFREIQMEHCDNGAD